MLELLREDIISEEPNTHIAKVFDTDAAAVDF